jgi:hypothetical protein
LALLLLSQALLPQAQSEQVSQLRFHLVLLHRSLLQPAIFQLQATVLVFLLVSLQLLTQVILLQLFPLGRTQMCLVLRLLQSPAHLVSTLEPAAVHPNPQLAEALQFLLHLHCRMVSLLALLLSELR